MRTMLLAAACCVAALIAVGPADADDEVIGENPRVVLETSLGNIVLELYPEGTPLTVTNFLEYVDSGFYDGLVFHRVVPNFVIQGGGFNAGMERAKTRPPIQNEAAKGIANEKYTISMARTADPHSATSQFFISLRDNTSSLDPNPRNKWGYCAFGLVVEGTEVVDAIGAVKTTMRGGMQDVPAEPVVITKAHRFEAPPPPPAEG